MPKFSKLTSRIARDVQKGIDQEIRGTVTGRLAKAEPVFRGVRKPAPVTTPPADVLHADYAEIERRALKVSVSWAPISGVAYLISFGMSHRNARACMRKWQRVERRRQRSESRGVPKWVNGRLRKRR
jgi:hypothetical protein